MLGSDLGPLVFHATDSGPGFYWKHNNRRTNLHTFIHSSLQGNRANASGQKGLKVKSFAFRIDLQSSECIAIPVHIYSLKLLINSLSCHISSLRLCISNSVNLTYGYLEDMRRTQGNSSWWWRFTLTFWRHYFLFSVCWVREHKGSIIISIRAPELTTALIGKIITPIVALYSNKGIYIIDPRGKCSWKYELKTLFQLFTEALWGHFGKYTMLGMFISPATAQVW